MSLLATSRRVWGARRERQPACRVLPAAVARGAHAPRRPPARRRPMTHLCAADGQQPGEAPQQQDDDGDGLLPEEDFEVPGTYMDAMNSNTKLGKAVRAAVEELEHLGDLETEVLQQCDGLLRKLGMKGSIFGSSGGGGGAGAEASGGEGPAPSGGGGGDG